MYWYKKNKSGDTTSILKTLATDLVAPIFMTSSVILTTYVHKQMNIATPVFQPFSCVFISYTFGIKNPPTKTAK